MGDMGNFKIEEPCKFYIFSNKYRYSIDQSGFEITVSKFFYGNTKQEVIISKVGNPNIITFEKLLKLYMLYIVNYV